MNPGFISNKIITVQNIGLNSDKYNIMLDEPEVK